MLENVGLRPSVSGLNPNNEKAGLWTGFNISIIPN